MKQWIASGLKRKLERFRDKTYRDEYLHSHVRAAIAYQIQSLRRKFGISQSEMGKQTGKPQSVISRLENDEYGRVTLKSLLDIASGMDVALVVQFVSYPEFLRRYSDFSDAKLQPATIHESIERAQSAGIAELTAYETTKRALETVIASPGEINWYGLVKAAGTDRLITDQRIADLRVN